LKRFDRDWYIDGCYPECHLQGENFFPSKLLNIPDILISDSIDKEEIGNFGRYRNLPTPYGACTIVAPKEIDRIDTIIWMANFIIQNMQKFKNAGATSMIFWIYWYGGQGNMEMTPKEIEKIHETGLNLCVDYIFIE
jgi:hypothetical protein